MAARRTLVRSYPSSVDIPVDGRTKINVVLNQQLGDASNFLSQVKQAHWNVKGPCPAFWQLQTLFDEVAEQAEGWIDELAERVTALGGLFTEVSRSAERYLYFLEAHLQDQRPREVRA